LLVLRFAIVLRVFEDELTLDVWNHPAILLIGIALCVAILIGSLTPLVSMATAMMQPVAYVMHSFVVDAYRTQYLIQSAETMLFCIALALLGPGIYAWDAALFGRREIVIPKGRHQR